MTVTRTIRNGPRARRWYDDETGGIVSSWLIQLTVIMAIVAVLGYEVISISLTALNLDDQAREVALEAREAYRDTRDIRAVEDRAEAAAESRDTQVVEVEVDDTNVYVRITSMADTLFVHRISALDNVTSPTARGRARWRP